MFKIRGLLAIPLVLAASVFGPRASVLNASVMAPRVSSIRDDAGLFSPDVVKQAQDRLLRVEGEHHVPVTIETIDSLGGRNIDAVLPEHAKASGAKGIYILISKQEGKIEVERSGDFARSFPAERLHQIRAAFIAGLKKDRDAGAKQFDSGLKQGVTAIESEAATAGVVTRAPARQVLPPGRGPVPGNANGGRGMFGIGSLFGIILIVLAVFIGIRLLGALMGGGNRGAYGPGARPGMGGGYGPGGGGGGGGGFMSSMFGGIGGALAGNWLYDQFSGRHHGSSGDAPYGTSDPGAQTPESTEWGGGDGGADWGGGGGGGGGDWGGGGGGGGDWGGGGGGGGDWGGGGGGGGDW